MQLFIKRLRERIAPTKVRYYGCGEYGDETAGRRPHYHLIIFGYGFADKLPWRKTASGNITYRSPLLEELWPHGHSEIGSVTRESGAYVARYCLKKVGGRPAKEHYSWIHPLTGQYVDLAPEFAIMSTRPGIGFGWFLKYETDAFPSAFVVIDGKKVPVPRYYKKQLAGRFTASWSDPDALLVKDDLSPTRAKLKARARTPEVQANQTGERLAVREELQTLKQRALKRD